MAIDSCLSMYTSINIILFTPILIHSIVSTYLPQLLLVNPICYCLSVNLTLNQIPSLLHSKGSIECSTAFSTSYYVSIDRLTPFLASTQRKTLLHCRKAKCTVLIISGLTGSREQTNLSRECVFQLFFKVPIWYKYCSW